MEIKDLQLRLLYPTTLSFKIKGEIKCFPDKTKTITTKTVKRSHYYQTSLARNVKETFEKKQKNKIYREEHSYK